MVITTSAAFEREQQRRNTPRKPRCHVRGQYRTISFSDLHFGFILLDILRQRYNPIMTNPPPLDYARVEPRRPISVLPHVITALLTTVCITLPMLIVILIVPRFEMVFKDFKTELPWITKLVLRISRWTANEYGWVAIFPLIVAAVLPGILLDRQSPTGHGARIYRRVMTRLLLLAMLSFVGIVIFACFMPMISIIDSVSGTARK